MRDALNTPANADKVAAQLHQEQWTVKVLKKMSQCELMTVLKGIKVCGFRI